MEDIDEDGSGQLEFEEFVMLSARLAGPNCFSARPARINGCRKANGCKEDQHEKMVDGKQMVVRKPSTKNDCREASGWTD